MSLLGGEGLEQLAAINHDRTQALVERLTQIPGVSLLSDAYFNEVTLVLPRDAREVVRELADKGILGGVSLGRLFPEQVDLHNGLLVTATETVTLEDIEEFAAGLAAVLEGEAA